MKAVIGALRVNLGLDSAQFARGLTDAQRRLQAVGKRMQMVGAAMSAVGAGIAIAVRGQLNVADDMGKAAQAIGVPVEALSQLRHAAEMSGSSFDGLKTGLRVLSRNMVDNADKFAELGIAVRDANGNMRPTTEVLFDLSDVLAGMPDGAEKTALAMELLGKSGADLIPTLNGGADALRAMMEEADALGLTISAETAANAAQFNDNLQRLQKTLSGLATILAGELSGPLAAITDFVVGLSQAFQNLSPETRKFVGLTGLLAIVIGPLVVVAGLLVSAIAAIGVPVAAAIAGIAVLTAVVAAFWPQIKAAGEAVATAWREFAPSWLQSALDGVIAALEAPFAVLSEMMGGVWALITGDIDKFKAVMAGLPSFILGKVQEIIGHFGEFVFGVLRALSQLQTDAQRAVYDLGAQLVATLKEIAGDMLEAAKQIGFDIIAGIRAGLEERWQNLKDTVYNLGTGMLDTIKIPLRSKSPSRAFAEIGHDIVDGLAIGITEHAQKPVDALTSIAETLKGNGGLIDVIKGFGGVAMNTFRAVALEGASLGKTLRANLSQWIGGMASNLFNTGFKSLWSGLGLPSFDGGGWTGNAARTGGLDGKGGFLAMMHPRERVLDTTKPGQGGGETTITVYSDPSVIVQASEGVFVRKMSQERPGLISQAVQATYRQAREVPIG